MYKIQFKFFVRLLLLLALSVIVVGCSNESASNDKPSNTNVSKTEKTTKTGDSAPQKGGEVVVASVYDISNFDPLSGASGGDHTFLWPIYDTLISFTPDLEPQPGLAESWEFLDDKTLVLHLRKNVKFHDVTNFDAEAVKFNIERANSEESVISDLENIETVEVVDQSTVKLHLKKPDSSILLALTDRGGMMVSPTAIKEDSIDLSQNPVGTGPFKMVNRIPNGEVVYERFGDYWEEGKPYLDKMTIKIMTQETTRINALKSGEADLIGGVAPSSIQTLEKDSNIETNVITSLRFVSMSINTSMPPFDNKEFRQAVSYAINREEIVNAITHGYGEPTSQAFPKDYWAANPNPIEYDPEKAKKLLQEDGLENISFTYLTSQDEYEPMLSEVIKDQLAKVGIEVKLEPMEVTALVSQFFNEKSAPAAKGGWTGRPDPQITVKALFSKDVYYNAGGYSTSELESLISKAGSTQDQAESAKLYAEINKIASAEEIIGYIPIFIPPVITAKDKKVKGFELNPLGKHVLSNIWIEQ